MIGLVSAIRVVGGGLHQYRFTVFLLPISQYRPFKKARRTITLLLLLPHGKAGALPLPADRSPKKVSRPLFESDFDGCASSTAARRSSRPAPIRIFDR